LAVACSALLGCGDFHELTVRAWSGQGDTILLEPIDVEVYGLADQLQYFFSCVPYGDAAREVRDMRSPAVLPALDYHHVSHLHYTSVFQAGLLQNGVERSWRDINTWLPSHGQGPWFARVLELPVAASRSRQSPPVPLQYTNQFPDLQAVSSFAYPAA